MRCNIILVIIAIILVAAITGVKELHRWLQNQRYRRIVRIETVRYEKRKSH